MLTGYWDALRYLAARLDARMRAARANDSQSGGMTLEWVIILVGIALAAVVVVKLFTAAVDSYSSKLP